MRRATSVVVTAAPVEARQLGQVIMVKTNFGFIKCCERAEDLFFHFTAVVRLALCVCRHVYVPVVLDLPLTGHPQDFLSSAP